jgi:hypothetical protein
VGSAQFQVRMERIEELIAAIQEHGNPVLRASAVELVRALLDVHRAGLAEMLAKVERQGAPGQAIMNALLQDDLVSRLLLLHGLHPVDLETRICHALEAVRSALHAHGTHVQLESATHASIRLRLDGGGQDARKLLEEAILAAAPDVLCIEFVDGAPNRVSLPLVRES